MSQLITPWQKHCRWQLSLSIYILANPPKKIVKHYLTYLLVWSNLYKSAVLVLIIINTISTCVNESDSLSTLQWVNPHLYLINFTKLPKFTCNFIKCHTSLMHILRSKIEVMIVNGLHNKIIISCHKDCWWIHQQATAPLHITIDAPVPSISKASITFNMLVMLYGATALRQHWSK